MQSTVWRHFRIGHPEDWEMLQYSCKSEQGVCAFADRHGFRLEFHWREYAAEPDFERILSEYRGHLQRSGALALKRSRHRQWHGLEARVGNTPTWRFGRYFSAERCLVELVFIAFEEAERETVGQILDSIAVEPACNGTRLWRAFGMAMRLPTGWRVQRCRVEPARAEVVSGPAAGRGQPEESFYRFGMVSEWLHGPVSDWLRRFYPSGGRDWKQAERLRTEHSIAAAAARVPGTRVAHGLGRRAPFRAEAWICPQDGRLYAVSCLGSAAAGDPEGELAGTKLQCCADLQV
jgi:hypothetical protein